jgi:hypothetical protein
MLAVSLGGVRLTPLLAPPDSNPRYVLETSDNVPAVERTAWLSIRASLLR